VCPMWSPFFSAATEPKGRNASPMRANTATPTSICCHVFIVFFLLGRAVFCSGHARRERGTLKHGSLSGLPPAAQISSPCLFFMQKRLTALLRRAFLPQLFPSSCLPLGGANLAAGFTSQGNPNPHTERKDEQERCCYRTLRTAAVCASSLCRLLDRLN